MFLRATAAFLLLVAFAFPTSAQTPSGEISGVVSDSTGSVVAGVKVTLTNSATNASSRAPDQRLGALCDTGLASRDLHAESRKGRLPRRRAQEHRGPGRQRESD